MKIYFMIVLVILIQDFRLCVCTKYINNVTSFEIIFWL